MCKIKEGDKVMFADAVVKRCGHSKYVADMRGTVVKVIDNRIARVDCGDTYISEEGNRVRSIPCANLVKVKS